MCDLSRFPLCDNVIQIYWEKHDRMISSFLRRVSRVLKILDNHLQKRYGISRDMIVRLIISFVPH
jgi:hypothetical protein